jgi:hypothetical protein
MFEKVGCLQREKQWVLLKTERMECNIYIHQEYKRFFLYKKKKKKKKKK